MMRGDCSNKLIVAYSFIEQKENGLHQPLRMACCLGCRLSSDEALICARSTIRQSDREESFKWTFMQGKSCRPTK
ncbi:hypothetical protein HB779_21745 (plasmid) [Phyllobacterium sp. 628]|uniref:hypothetical protein n=1 Tax=Phyllobacterium sp. 628 TaxID=2718938 RepID=UPI0016625434|nr:hypothetical protein [Phyllobacterium sp. 628]QND54536.1 hypothetical protein HB779_21745 [Phyllobacterium sp. 628]